MTSRVAPAPPDAVQRVTELRARYDFPLYTHTHWSAQNEWLVHGITDRTADMSLFGAARSADVLPRWSALRDALDCDVIVHARQLHRADVIVHEILSPGILIANPADGHATSRHAALLAVSVADCVPISVIAPSARAVALLHGGWRGVAAGIVERGIDVLTRRFGADVAGLHVHCGPAICGECFEVGAEVPPQLGADPDATHVDLRAVVALRAVQLGVPAANVSISTHCTRCGDSPFYSHRGGSAERQIAVLGVRPATTVLAVAETSA